MSESDERDPRPAPSAPGVGDGALRRVLSELARHLPRPLRRDLPRRLRRLRGAALRARRAREGGLGRAREELRLVHRREQALLLRWAAELAIARTLDGRLFTAPAADAPDRRRWEALCDEAVGAALADGCPVDGTLLLCMCLAGREGPGAVELARDAQALAPSAAGRLLVARALFASGRRAEARALYAECAREPRELMPRGALLEARAGACEHAGELARALVHLRRAVLHDAGERAELAALLLAATVGDAAALREASERLDRPELERADGRARVQRALHELEARWSARAAAAPARTSAAVAGLVDTLRAHGAEPVRLALARLAPEARA